MGEGCYWEAIRDFGFETMLNNVESLFWVDISSDELFTFGEDCKQ